MPIMEAIGWFVITFAPLSMSGVGPAIDRANEGFTMQVDTGNSCWDRVGGEVGTYGKPSDYSLDLMCNWRIKKYEKVEEVKTTGWELVREKVDSVKPVPYE